MKNVNEVKGLASLINTEFLKEHCEVDRDQGLIEWEHDRILVTLKTYERFLILGKDASSAWMLYCFYFYKARKDGTNQPWATDNYCYNEKGLNWSKDKFTKIKKLLIENGFIETIKRRNEKGRITGHYIRVVGIPRARIYNYHNPENQGNGNIHNPDFTTSGKNPPVVKPVTSALIKTNKVLKENNKQIVSCYFADSFFKKFQVRIHEKIFKENDLKIIEKCVNNMLNTETEITKPIAYLVTLIKTHETVHEIVPKEKKAVGKERISRREKRLGRLDDLESDWIDYPAITKVIHKIRIKERSDDNGPEYLRLRQELKIIIVNEKDKRRKNERTM